MAKGRVLAMKLDLGRRDPVCRRDVFLYFYGRGIFVRGSDAPASFATVRTFVVPLLVQKTRDLSVNNHPRKGKA